MAKSVDMVARKRMKEEAEARLRYQSALMELARLAGEIQGADSMISLAFPVIARAVGADCLLWIEKVPGGLLPRAVLGLESAKVAPLMVGDVESCLAGHVLRTRRPLAVPDFTTERHWKESAKLATEGFTSALLVPVLGREGEFGVLGACTKKQRSFFQHDSGFLQTAGAMLAVAIDRCAANERARVLCDLAADLGGVREIDDLLARTEHRARQALACDMVATYCWDEGRGLFSCKSQSGCPEDRVAELQAVAYGPGSWLAGCMRQDGTLVVNDVSSQHWLPPTFLVNVPVGAFIAVPLRCFGSELGALVAFITSAARAFTAADVRLCEGIAGQLATALYAAMANAAREEDARVERALATSGRTILGLHETREVLERLCWLTTELLHCDCGYSFLYDSRTQSYVPVTSVGLSPEERSKIDHARIPRALLAGLTEALQREEVVQIAAAQGSEDSGSALNLAGASVGLLLGIRCGGELAAIQAAMYRREPRSFTSRQVCTARRIACLGSTALEHMRVREEVGRTGKWKAEFVHTMSHELRTPLHVIIGYTDLLLEGVLGSLTREQEESLRQVAERTRELLGLIKVTLALTQLEGGELPEEVDPTALATEMKEEFRSKAGGAFPRQVWRVAPDLPVIQTNKAKLKAVMREMIENALKFTPPDGVVTVDVQGCDDGLEVIVKDTGIGIESGLIPTLFEPFQRPGNVSGIVSGLGLYLVRRLVDALGGTVTVESAPGVGSTFRVWLPRERSVAVNGTPSAEYGGNPLRER